MSGLDAALHEARRVMRDASALGDDERTSLVAEVTSPVTALADVRRGQEAPVALGSLAGHALALAANLSATRLGDEEIQEALFRAASDVRLRRGMSLERREVLANEIESLQATIQERLPDSNALPAIAAVAEAEVAARSLARRALDLTEVRDHGTER
jgi:hypothetical protein